MLQHRLIARSPAVLRFLRTRLFLDWHCLLAALPQQGRILDVGCGIGSLDYTLGRARPDLEVLGIDLDAATIRLAQRHHALANVKYAATPLEATNGQFDCILFVDVFHHVAPKDVAALLDACRPRLTPDGYVLIKDIERRRGEVSLFLDRVVSRCDGVWLRDCSELAQIVDMHLSVKRAEVRFRMPFPHYYIHASAA